MAGRGDEIPRDMASKTERSERKEGGNVGAKVRGSGGAGESDIRAEGARDNIDGHSGKRLHCDMAGLQTL